MAKGFVRNPTKSKDPIPRPPNLSSTSGSRRYLNQLQKIGTPEQLAEAQRQVAEIHPDMLIERRHS